MGSIPPEGEAQDLFRHVGIYCPHFLTDRFRVMSDIKAHGGLIQNKLAQADILLAENNPGMDYYRPLLAERKSSHSHIVDRGWLYDSISEGTIRDPASYQPSYLGDLSRVASSSQPSKKAKVKTNERQLRSIYSGSEVAQIVNVLVIMSDWSNVSVIARCLSLLHDRHSYESYRSHIQYNMDKGKHYRARAMKRREELGPEGQVELKEILCNVNPEVRNLMDWKASSVSTARGNTGKELIPPERPTRREVDQGREQKSSSAKENAGGEESSGKGSSSEEHTEMSQEDEARIMRDACVSADLHRTMEIGTGPSKSQEDEGSLGKDRIEERYRELSPASAVLIPTRQFPHEERQKLIESLTVWLRTRFVANTSSQDSVIGIIDSSQEIPRPPMSLFTEIASEIPVHSIKEWKEHYESGRNQEGYLILAKEALEKSFALEREEAIAFEKQAVLEIKKGGEVSRSTSEEVEEQIPTQEQAVEDVCDEIFEDGIEERLDEEAEEELEANPEAYLDAQPRRLFFSSEDGEASEEEEEVDELESSDEEDESEKSKSSKDVEGEEEELTIRHSPAKETSAIIIADSLDSGGSLSDVREEVEVDSGFTSEQEEEISSEDDQEIGAKISLTRKGKEREVIDEGARRRSNPIERKKQRQAMIPYVEICTTRQSPFYAIQTKAENASQKLESRKRPRLMSVESDDLTSMRNNNIPYMRNDDEDYRMSAWNSPRNREIMARSSSRDLRNRTTRNQRHSIIISSSGESSRQTSTSFSKSRQLDRSDVAALVAQEHLPQKVVRKTKEQRLQALADEYKVPVKTVEIFFKTVNGDLDKVERMLLSL